MLKLTRLLPMLSALFALTVFTGDARAASIAGTGVSSTLGFSFESAVAENALAIAEADAATTDILSETFTSSDAGFIDPFRAFAEASASALATVGHGGFALISGTTFSTVSFINPTDEIMNIEVTTAISAATLESTVDFATQITQLSADGFISIVLVENAIIVDELLLEAVSIFVEGADVQGFDLLGLAFEVDLEPGQEIVATAGASFHGVSSPIPEPGASALFASGFLLVVARLRTLAKRRRGYE